MARTTIYIDDALLAQAQATLATKGITATVNAALADVVRHAQLRAFDIRVFDVTDEDIAAARSDRTGSDQVHVA